MNNPKHRCSCKCCTAWREDAHIFAALIIRIGIAGDNGDELTQRAIADEMHKALHGTDLFDAMNEIENAATRMTGR